MASYQTQILDAPPQYGFLPGLASGISGGAEKFSNIYAESMMKDMLAKQEAKRKMEAINKFQAAMQQDPNMEMDAVSMDESGSPKWTYKRKEEPFKKDPMKAIKQAMLGFGAEDTGRAMGIQPQTPMAPDIMSQVLPISQMTGQQVSAQGTPIDYGETVKKSLMSRFAPGMESDQVMRDLMGFKAEKEQKTFDPATTQTVRKNVKTPEDIDELLKNRKDYEDAGVDVVGILKEFINSGKADPTMIQKIMKFFTED